MAPSLVLSLWCWWRKAETSIRFRKRAWSRRVRIQLEGKLSRSAKGMTTGRGSRSRCAFQWRRVIASAWRRSSRPRSVRRSALALVDPPRLLFGLVHRQLEAARRVLVVDRARRRRFDEGGAGLDREDLRPHVPRLRVLHRCRGDELLPALQHADRVVGLHRAVALLDDHELAVEEARLGVVEALRREPREEHDVLGRAEPLDDLGEPALPGAALGEHDRRERILELPRDGHEVEEALVRLLAHEAERVDVPRRLVEEIATPEEGERLARSASLIAGCRASFSLAGVSAAFSASTRSARSAASIRVRLDAERLGRALRKLGSGSSRRRGRSCPRGRPRPSSPSPWPAAGRGGASGRAPGT